MSTFAPDHLQPSTLRSLAKALKRASGDLFGTPLPLGQAQELLARTFDYPTWAAAIARAEQNRAGTTPSGPSAAQAPVLMDTMPLTSRQAFAHLVKEARGLRAERPVNEWMTHLSHVCAEWGEPTWSAWCLSLAEVPLAELPAALDDLVGGVPAEPVAHLPEVPNPYARNGVMNWDSLQGGWQSLWDASETFWSFLPEFVHSPDMARLKRQKGDLISEMPGMWAEWQANQGQASRWEFQVRQLSATVPGAAILLAWMGSETTALEAYTRVAHWVLAVERPITVAVHDRADRVHAALGTPAQRALAMNLLDLGMSTGRTTYALLTDCQALLIQVGYAAMARYFADLVWGLRAQVWSNTAEGISQDLAQYDRKLGLTLLDHAFLGTFQNAIRGVAQHARAALVSPLDPVDIKLLAVSHRLAEFVSAGVSAGGAIARMLSHAQAKDALGDAQEADWLKEWQALVKEGRPDFMKTWILAHPEFDVEVRLAVAIAWSVHGHSSLVISLQRDWFANRLH